MAQGRYMNSNAIGQHTKADEGRDSVKDVLKSVQHTVDDDEAVNRLREDMDHPRITAAQPGAKFLSAGGSSGRHGAPGAASHDVFYEVTHSHPLHVEDKAPMTSLQQSRDKKQQEVYYHGEDLKTPLTLRDVFPEMAAGAVRDAAPLGDERLKLDAVVTWSHASAVQRLEARLLHGREKKGGIAAHVQSAAAANQKAGFIANAGTMDVPLTQEATKVIASFANQVKEA